MDRRNFVRTLMGSSALSIVALSQLNAAVYRHIAELNKKYLEDDAPDGAYWDAVAGHFLFEDGLLMMNNGTLGPMPETVFNTLMAACKMQVANPFDCYNYLPGKKEEVRRKVAAFIGASPDEVVINRNTTEGMNLIAGGLDLKEGDEVIISSMEHPAGHQPWLMRQKRSGIRVVEAPIGAPPSSVDEIVQVFEKAITPRTRVISVSHTVYLTGLIFPVKEVAEMAHKKDILLVADSAHGFGMLDLNMKQLGIDVWASSPYKWSGAPTGCGVLYIRKEIQDRIWPAIASSGWDTNKTARRFETLGQRSDPLIVALGEAINFQNRIGKSRIARRIRTLAGYLKRELKTISGVRVHTSEDPYLSGGLTAFSMEGMEPEKIVNYLREKYNIVIRTVGRDKDHTRGVRVSTNIFISMKHIDRLLEGVKHLSKHRS
jgi:selenocysteine lyase/cysteine desulfurase